MAGAAFEIANVRRIGFLADTHCRRADGSDLPQQALDAFAGVDLIVHLGDVGQKGVLRRLGEIAPVWVSAGGDRGWVPFESLDAPPCKVIEAGGVAIGLAFNLTKPDQAIAVEESVLRFEKPVVEVLKSRFGRTVDAVAFGGTHRQRTEVHDGVVFFDPGSPTLPSDKKAPNDLGSVSVLDLSKGKVEVEPIRLEA